MVNGTTANQSWLSRVGASFIAALLGIVLIPGSVIGVFWNEGRSVQTAKSLDEGARAFVAVPVSALDDRNNGRLVYFTGPLQLAGEASDPVFGISVPMVQLRRIVQMYQWIEESQSSSPGYGDNRETSGKYVYRTDWDDDVHDSSRFHDQWGHENPAKRFDNATNVAPRGDVGAFRLGPEVLGKLDGAQTLPLVDEFADKVIAVTGPPAQRLGQEIYVGANPNNPVVGDLRISFEVVDASSVSVIGEQSAGSVAAYQTDAGDRLLLIDKGTRPPAAMFEKAHDDNRVLTWILRGVGLLVMFVGFVMLLFPLPTLVSFIPIVGKAAGFGVMLIALVLTALLGASAIALAWFFYRPLLSAGLLTVVGAAVGGLIYLRRRAV
ncbi:TMEM43 family protein [Smaragdicoccus niigatensis]|uniref:TMEM43 family protein n=1 Tax=Smaragdicoccus niigatensis TaxID=359359 RepID=UPI00037D41DD|nr:TMEM43 family protein [Smaragdicoccus niigatensis]